MDYRFVLRLFPARACNRTRSSSLAILSLPEGRMIKLLHRHRHPPYNKEDSLFLLPRWRDRARKPVLLNFMRPATMAAGGPLKEGSRKDGEGTSRSKMAPKPKRRRRRRPGENIIYSIEFNSSIVICVTLTVAAGHQRRWTGPNTRSTYLYHNQPSRRICTMWCCRAGRAGSGWGYVVASRGLYGMHFYLHAVGEHNPRHGRREFC